MKLTKITGYDIYLKVEKYKGVRNLIESNKEYYKSEEVEKYIETIRKEIHLKFLEMSKELNELIRGI